MNRGRPSYLPVAGVLQQYIEEGTEKNETEVDFL